jgi:glycosyltransferase involved in cell wall biosynthesis
METIAILMTVKNGAGIIKKALDSIVNQTAFKKGMFDYKIVIVNDLASTDNLLEVVSEYENIIYAKSPEKGLVAGRNTSLFTAMKITDCDYFSILDCDDEWLLNKIEIQLPFVIENKIDVCGTGMFFHTKDGVKEVFYPETHEQILHSYHIGNNPMAHPSLIFNKRILTKCGGYDDSCVSEDYDLFSRAVKHYQFYNIPKLLVNYTYDYENRSPEYSEKINKGAEKIYLKFLVNHDKIGFNR